MALITCRDLALGYESRAILEHLSFSVNAGDYLCIVGENGSGKSTLMRTMLGLQKPLGGSIEFGDGMRHNEIGYLPQQTAIQKDFPATVWEIVLSGFQARVGKRAFYNRSEKALAQQNLARMGMTDYVRRCYRELSGGQQQRVLLARALCATRKLLLLDEPVAGLDPKVTAEMYALIERLNREGTVESPEGFQGFPEGKSRDLSNSQFDDRAGVTIIMISHDIAAAVRYATHILHVGGEHTFFGTVDEYRESAMGSRFIAPDGGEQG